MLNTQKSIARRSAVIATLTIVASTAIISARVASLDAKPTATPAASTTSRAPSDRWLDGLKSKHRQFFDAPAPGGGIPLVHVMNYYDTYNKAYGVKDADIDAVLTFYGSTTFHALSDAVWAKYALGEFLDIVDPATGKPATANPWRSAPVILGMTIPAASIESLQKRGGTFIVCNNALQIFSSLLAKKRGLDATTVFEDLKANILPGVELVPGMVVAVEQAQRAGLAYHRQ
jgi:intracellular sulfur oxidation DsrE/DsrF family protein